VLEHDQLDADAGRAERDQPEHPAAQGLEGF
jgi:hypothetical protein